MGQQADGTKMILLGQNSRGILKLSYIVVSKESQLEKLLNHPTNTAVLPEPVDPSIAAFLIDIINLIKNSYIMLVHAIYHS